MEIFYLLEGTHFSHILMFKGIMFQYYIDPLKTALKLSV